MNLKRKYSILSIPERIHPHPDYTGKGVTIAFVDSGFFPHPELAKRIVKFVDVTKENYEEQDFLKISASSWHGTMVACAACGSGSWSKGHYRGIAYESEVILIKAFDGKKIRSTGIQKALEWVIANHQKHGIRIVNISMGGDRNETAALSVVCKSIQKLTRIGITVVAAAGNAPTKPIVPPASCSSTITVGGVDDHNSLNETDFTDYGSTYGYTLDGHLKPEIIAPARRLPAPMLPDNAIYEESLILHTLEQTPLAKIKSALTKNLKKTGLDKSLTKSTPAEILIAVRKRLESEKFFCPQYQHVDGTSFAAPIISSVIAQMIEANPRMTPVLIKMILETTAKRISSLAPEKQGRGYINARECVERALVETELLEFEKTPKVLDDRIIFYYRHPEAKKVSLVGDFTAWKQDLILMNDIQPGVWRADIPRLSDGYYHYKFVVDDTDWLEDPLNPMKANDHHNGLNSVILVRGNRKRARVD